jgi:hypothetical protein
MIDIIIKKKMIHINSADSIFYGIQFKDVFWFEQFFRYVIPDFANSFIILCLVVLLIQIYNVIHTNKYGFKILT